MKKRYINAPLPFQGQKRNFLSQFRDKIKEYAADATFIDVFGGSGLLSRTIKDTLPDAKVVYNDFDEYEKRLKNIPTTNILLSKIRELITKYPNNSRLPLCLKEKILNLIKNDIAEGYFVDYITISSNILFGGKYANNFLELQKAQFYQKASKSDYKETSDYLSGIEVIRKDYLAVFEAYKNAKNVVFVLDPPYLTTDQKSYKKENYWGLYEHLKLLEVFDNHNYIMFTSDKSQIVELLQYFENRFDYKQHLTVTPRKGLNSANGIGSVYQDLMLNQFSPQSRF